ncbi:ribbon-helix-helix protein, CopG family [Saccharothrix sp. AJ9571]|uniref:Arc/MetJ-type ribon-helix-helix transcriptional regulator n=1 Tax=Amycolatopsis magusensis TaxID=882444 RepID=A0ABS4Q347_9PSEU|nr:ribbon-helix-helix protein, CopG family [Amycolatopsis magusensis]MBP2186112.1 Arc/MetJ-type ribon-helix-helix transcriptional regulator [Amycolatopsis magusensis]UJW36270.1 ribbon-helix-helix protein, CopG family [Saccharothrix sp. AJ9571]
MKLSVSLSDEDVAFIDHYAAAADVPSRSAVVHRALELLRASQLEDDYRAAWDEWTAHGDEAEWDAATGDGVLTR